MILYHVLKEGKISTPENHKTAKTVIRKTARLQTYTTVSGFCYM